MEKAFLWMKGLFAAIIGGVAQSAIVLIADPKTFNFQEGLRPLLNVAGATAILFAAAYLKKSPLPGVKNKE